MAHAENTVINHALRLISLERADVVEKLLVSLDQPDSNVDSIWAKEADARVEAYKRGEIEAIPAEEVFSKYSRL